MNTDKTTESIIRCAIQVSNTLGAGFLEKVYENALVLEIKKTGLVVEQQKYIKVKYDEVVVGDYIADIVVDDLVLLEIKAVQAIINIHQAQLLNYMKATGLKVGLILNFGTPKVGIKRMVL
jgi:GxxExxY protein